MRRALVWTAAVALVGAGVLPRTAAAQAGASATGMRGEILKQLDDAQKKLADLAEATPAEKFAWRPGKGVRSVGEVYLHVAQANYFLPTLWGAKPPAGVDVQGIEKDGDDKAKTVAALKQSFDHLHKAMAAVSDAELGKSVNLFGRQGTTREAMLILATHAHEHLGQAIAYARMNGIVPPWTAAEQAKQGQKKEGR
ncbi:MAG: DinB family protein [Acidobacteriota bacterium]|nr:DinB family protein [Acidobacteriota bacterium]